MTVAPPVQESAAAVAATTDVRRGTSFVALLLVLGAVSWRRGDYFSGSLDAVVVAKAAVTVLAVVLAFGLAASGRRRRVGTGSLWWLGLVLASSVFGAWTDGNLRAGGVIAVRVALLGAVLFFLLRAAPAVQVLMGIARGCGVVALVASLTGLPTLSSGRLAGGVPAMDPNELALLAGIVLVFVAWRAVLGEARWPAGLAGLYFAGVLWATGSRTALLVLVLGVLLMAVQMRSARVGLVVGSLVLAAAGTVGAATTGVLTGFAERDGAGASTLGSRYIAWRAALGWADTGWRRLFGGGLSLKTIHVRGQYWDTQPLDSSWVSVLVQAGGLGLLVAVCWVLWALRRALRTPYPHRVLFCGLLVFVLGRSLTESGLFDATSAFLLFLAVSLLAEGGSADRLRAETVDREPAAT